MSKRTEQNRTIQEMGNTVRVKTNKDSTVVQYYYEA